MFSNFLRDFDLSQIGIDMGAIAGIVYLTAIYTAIIAIVCLALYILRALGIYNMAKNAGLSNPWVAFVPIANSYTFGKLAEKYRRKDGKQSEKFSVLLLIFDILTLIACVCLIIFSISSVLIILSNAKIAYDIGTDMTLSQFSSLIPVIVFYVVTLLCAVVYTVLHYVAYWRIVAAYDYSNATLYTVLSVFFSFLDPIFLFILRNKQPVFDPRERFAAFTSNI